MLKKGQLVRMSTPSESHGEEFAHEFDGKLAVHLYEQSFSKLWTPRAAREWRYGAFYIQGPAKKIFVYYRFVKPIN